MDGSGADGATAAAIYFATLYPWVYQSGDLSAWNAMSGDTCKFCASVAASVAESVRGGETNTGGDITIASSRVAEPSNGYFTVELHVTTAPSATRNSSGEVTGENQGSDSVLTLALSTKGNRWMVDGVDAKDVEK